MRILAVADFHGNSSAESYLSKFLTRGFDCVVLIGDLTDFGPPEVAESLLELVKRTGTPCLAVPGNCGVLGVSGLMKPAACVGSARREFKPPSRDERLSAPMPMPQRPRNSRRVRARCSGLNA